MPNLNNEIITKLNHLVTIVNDGKNGYRLAAEKEENCAIKASFQHLADEREVCINELKELITELGGKVADAFSPAIKPRNNWMEVNAVAGDDCVDMVIGACIHGEKATIKAYQKNLNEKKIAGNVRMVLTRHLSGMEYAVRKITSHLTPTL